MLYIGEGIANTTFDCTNLPDYQELTSDNFWVKITGSNSYASGGANHEYHTIDYNPTTGQLFCYFQSSGGGVGRSYVYNVYCFKE